MTPITVLRLIIQFNYHGLYRRLICGYIYIYRPQTQQVTSQAPYLYTLRLIFGIIDVLKVIDHCFIGYAIFVR